MSKFFTLLAVLAISVSTSFSQVCTPDSTLIDAEFPVQPLPFDPINSPDGGIPDTACIGLPYFFPFQAAVGDTLNAGIAMLPLDSIRLPIVGGIGGLPPGLNYECNPGDCVFRKNTLGCIAISGTVMDPAAVGEYDLTLSVEAFLNGSSSPTAVSLPIPTVTPGSYTIVVRPADFTNCSTVSSEDLLSDLITLRNVPNPFNGMTSIELTSAFSGEVNFEVFDMVGTKIHKEEVQLLEGKNAIPFNGTDLQSGIYFYAIKNHLGFVSEKMVVSK